MWCETLGALFTFTVWQSHFYFIKQTPIVMPREIKTLQWPVTALKPTSIELTTEVLIVVMNWNVKRQCCESSKVNTHKTTHETLPPWQWQRFTDTSSLHLTASCRVYIRHEMFLPSTDQTQMLYNINECTRRIDQITILTNNIRLSITIQFSCVTWSGRCLYFRNY